MITVFFHTSANCNSFNAQDLNGREIASRLNSDKYKIHMIVGHDEKVDERLIRENITIHRNPFKNKYLQKTYRVWKKLSIKADVGFYIRVFHEDFVCLLLNKIWNPKQYTIHMVENMLPYPNAGLRYNMIAKYNAWLSTRVIPISEKVCETCNELYGVNDERISIGVNLEIFSKRNVNVKSDNEKARVLGCGTLQERKRPGFFLDAAKKFPEVDFIWYGEGPLRKELEERVSNEKCANVFFRKNINHEKLSEEMFLSDIFLFPSNHEGFPKVIVEAMASGLPVIAFNDYGPEAIVNNKTGFVVGEKCEMFDKLEYLIKNEAVRKEFSIEAIKRASEFDWDIIVKKWERVIDCCLREKKC